MKLLRELTEEVQYIREEKDDKSRFYLSGIFAQADVVNRNKRIYPVDILDKEITRFCNEDVKNKNAIGELNHPSGPSVNLDRAAILIKEMKRDGSNFIGKALVLETPMGKIVENLINDGARLGVSTRALGSLKPNNEGINVVGEDLKLITIDVVGNPSAPSAYVDAVCEGREWIYDVASNEWIPAEEFKKIEQLIEKHQKIIETKTAEEVKELAPEMLKEYIDSTPRMLYELERLLRDCGKKKEEIKEVIDMNTYIKKFLPPEKHYLIKD